MTGNKKTFDINFEELTPEEIEAQAKKGFDSQEDKTEELEEKDSSTQQDNNEEVSDEDSDEAKESEETEESLSEEADDAEEVEDVNENASEDTSDNSSQTSNTKKQGGDRFNKRVRELVAQRKAAEDFAFKQANEKAALEKRLYEAEKERLAAKKESLSALSTNFKQQMSSAAAEQDFAKFAEIQQELSKISTQMVAVEGLEKKYEGEFKPTTTENYQAPASFDMKRAESLAKDWEFNNPRVLADQAFRETSQKIGRMLVDRGITPDSEEFYEELTNRVNSAFGLNTKTPSSRNNQENRETNEEPKKTLVVKKGSPKSVVAGASRTPSPTQSKGAGSRTVTLSADEIAYAKSNNLDLKSYAKYKDKMETAIKTKGKAVFNLFD